MNTERQSSREKTLTSAIVNKDFLCSPHTREQKKANTFRAAPIKTDVCNAL
jgi:hypothetical protein